MFLSALFPQRLVDSLALRCRALSSYVAAVRIPGASWPQRLLQLFTALLAVSTATAVLLFGVVAWP